MTIPLQWVYLELLSIIEKLYTYIIFPIIRCQEKKSMNFELL